MKVKSVYNFVPAPEETEVYKPEWADQVSHDIPFRDGESGEIEIEITAKTPVFIRNGHSKKDAELFKETLKNPKFKPNKKQQEKIDNYLSFSNYNMRYFIPATSLKGMFRNTLEIMSFARLETQDNIFPLRNLENKAYQQAIIYNRNIKSGWLQKIDDKWKIIECEHKRIPIRSIEKKYSSTNKRIVFNDQTAIDKYKLIGIENLEVKCSYVRDLGFTKPNKQFIKSGELYDFGNNGDNFKGKLVFFGSMGNKKYEYIFGEEDKTKIYNISTDLFQKFTDIEDKLEEDSLWNYLRKKTEKIPVLFFAEKKSVVHFGFSRLYKLPNVNRMHELNPIKTYPTNLKSKDMDLPQVIFGASFTTKDNEGKNVIFNQKGRVYIGNAWVENLIEFKGPVTAVLNSPKASYYPFYLKEGKTYLDKKAGVYF